MQNYFVILSEGCYSDYSPDYYIGSKEITNEEFLEKAKEVKNDVIKEFESLPSRKHQKCSYGCYSFCPENEKYDPKNGERVGFPKTGEFFLRMQKWLNDKGFKRLPDEIPEINIAYDLVDENNGF